jgi:two-component system phosphate regulon sensor histidine kinase PhoR
MWSSKLFRSLLLSHLLVAALGVGIPALAVVLVVSAPDERSFLGGCLIGSAVCSALTALIVSVLNAGRAIRPLRALMEAAEEVGARAAGQRVFPERRDEVGQLGRAFNRMSERLADRIARLEEDRQQLRTILSGMVEGVVALDAEQRILFVNDRATELLELSASAAVGRRLWEVVRHRPLLDVVSRALDRPEAWREEINPVAAWSGDHATVGRSLTVHAARLPGPPPRGAVLVLHDTSELRRLERLRQEFVANVSHELKTPLSVIKANVETLMLGAVEDAENRGQFLDRIARQSDRLYALILDLLSLARIESGDELFEFQAVPIGSVLRACLERHRPRAEARGQTLSLEDDGADPAVWADEEALDQIFDNLVDNAVKYTPSGGQVHVTWHAEGECLCVAVSDTGIGIPEADLPRVFERFYRVDKARSREMGGTGLGLSIVKHLVGAMNGSVRAASRVGEGTMFTVCLPRASAP